MISICRNVRLCVCPTVRLFTFEVPMKRLFAPTSRSRMSNIFRDSESLGEIHGKKWSQIWTFSKHRPSGQMLSISWNVRLSVCLCVCSLLRCHLNFFLPPLPKVECPIFLEIRNPSGKVMEWSSLRFENFCLKIVQNQCAKKSLFFCWFCLTKHGGNHTSRWIRDVLLIVQNQCAKKSLFFCWFCLTKHGGNHTSRWIRGVLLILAYL